MSNSPLVQYTKISPFRNSPRSMPIDRISPHCVVGQCSIEALGTLFASDGRNASSNYGIGVDGRVGMYVEEKDRSWCTSSAANDNRAVTIECASDASYPYAFKPVVYEKLIELCIDICRRNGKTKLLWLGDKERTLAYTPKSDEMIITVHRWFANKSCPGDWLYSRLWELANRVTAALNPEPEPVQEDDEMLSYEQFEEYMDRYLKERRDNDAANWSKDAREWLVNAGIVTGGSPLPNGDPNYSWEDFVTKEQAGAMLYRFSQKMGMAFQQLFSILRTKT